MDVRIAVGRSDGVHVDQHFGKSHSFRIFRLHDDGVDFIEQREVRPFCASHTHDDNALELAAQGISDCRGVIVCQIGSGAIDVLIGHRIMAFTLPGTITEAFEALIKSKRFALTR